MQHAQRGSFWRPTRGHRADRSPWLCAPGVWKMLAASVLLCWFAGGLAIEARAADRIVLRNLNIISDRRVERWDEDGVRLDNQQLVTWDAIEQAAVGAERQAEFDRMLKELGTPLYRVRQRMAAGDFLGLKSPVEKLYPRYAGRTGATAYLVSQAKMWTELAAGQREFAVAPLLECVRMLGAQPELADSLPGKRRLQLEKGTGIDRELEPVWFNREAAAKVLPTVFQAVSRLPRPIPPGARIYYASLALAAGEAERAAQVLRATPPTTTVAGRYRELLLVAAEIEAGRWEQALAWLNQNWAKLPPTHQPLALYLLGRAELKHGSKEASPRALLHLLRVPAVYSESHSDIAAAALAEAIGALRRAGNAAAAERLERELLENFTATYHARAARNPRPTP